MRHALYCLQTSPVSYRTRPAHNKKDMCMFEFYRVAAAVPILRVADVDFNISQIVSLIKEANEAQASLVIFPELCVTGYTCADLFHQSRLQEQVHSAMDHLCSATINQDIIVIVGMPLLHGNNLYNCAVLLQRGEIKGIVPKSFLPNYKEFYEKRWFQAGANIREATVTLNDKPIPFGVDLLFAINSYFTIGIELCEDLWNVIPPSSYHATAGATILVNLSASNELVAKADYRRDLVRMQSARCVSTYIYTSSGVTESSTDVLHSGHAIIAENGIILRENERFKRHSHLIFADTDCERLVKTRIMETSFSDNSPLNYRHIKLNNANKLSRLNRTIHAHPFVPQRRTVRDNRCQEILLIQASALAKRLEHAQVTTAVIGISGGLDSTLALLVTCEAFKLLGRIENQIIAVTMPGFGTSHQTYTNAVQLCRNLNTDFREINIEEACLKHFQDIDHDSSLKDITFENVQARERTQILMDLANKEGGIVIGTGDLSEIALGWSTYNGDHMSMYAVNSSVPKTLIQYLIKWIAERSEDELKKNLIAILKTPITPELLPNSKTGSIIQKTENIIGPYELHDFFLYHMIKYGASPKKIKFLAEIAFSGKYQEDEIEKWLRTFLKRFFSHQFKRSCIPDGPKVGTINLSPRGDWRMPSDASDALWLE